MSPFLGNNRLGVGVRVIGEDPKFRHCKYLQDDPVQVCLGL